MQKKIEQIFFLFEIIVSQLVPTDFLYSLSKGRLKHGFLDIYLTMFFGAVSSGNTSAMTVIFFR